MQSLGNNMLTSGGKSPSRHDLKSDSLKKGNLSETL